METDMMKICICVPYHCLNRTMQYGNFCFQTPKLSSVHSLNRTMQYGNLTLLLNWFGVIVFKSYYVVWKPVQSRGIYFPSTEFKSYYVVWKPCAKTAFALTAVLFKSYYVVWKQQENKKDFDIPVCLNRTMQYGNREVFPINRGSFTV